MVSPLALHGRVEGKAFVRSGGPLIMEKQQIATIVSFCLNEACVDYQKISTCEMAWGSSEPFQAADFAFSIFGYFPSSRLYL